MFTCLSRLLPLPRQVHPELPGLQRGAGPVVNMYVYESLDKEIPGIFWSPRRGQSKKNIYD